MYYQSEPVTMWFDRRLVMRRSPVHGTGTFATHPIREGERLMWVTGGIVYSTEDWRTGRVQLTARFYGDIYHASGVQRELRNQMFRSGSESACFAGLKWMYEGIAPHNLFPQP